MLVELIKYKDLYSFIFKHNDVLSKVCNAPKDKAGIYVVYGIKNKRKELLYIGRSGKVNSDGSLFIRQGSLWDRLVNGKEIKNSEEIFGYEKCFLKKWML